MQLTPNDYGRDRYSYIGGVRYKVGMLRTIQPKSGETNSQFERRMEGMERELREQHGCTSVSIDFELRGGAIVQAIVDATYPPTPAPIADDDDTVAGGRVTTAPRGGRGGQRPRA
jgi:hypothetical protein